eukprot:8183449-Alexandrium_andersonii.AAC.1
MGRQSLFQTSAHRVARLVKPARRRSSPSRRSLTSRLSGPWVSEVMVLVMTAVTCEMMLKK